MVTTCVRKLTNLLTSALVAVAVATAVGLIVTAALSTILLAPLVVLWVAAGGTDLRARARALGARVPGGLEAAHRPAHGGARVA